MNPDPAAARRDRVLFLLAAACVVLQFPGSVPLAALSLGTWVLALARLDRKALQRMGRPRFWAVTLLLALATGIVLGPRDLTVLGVPLSRQGLSAGLLMVIRGALIFGIASFAGPALAGRRMSRGLARSGMTSLGGAATVALGLLPELKNRLAGPGREAPLGPRGLRDRVARIHDLAVRAFCETIRVAEELGNASGRASGPRIVVVVGDPGQGKTGLVQDIARRCREAGLPVAGVVQPAVTEEGIRVGYDLLDVATGDRRPFARSAASVAPGSPRYTFESSGWDWAADRIRRGRQDAKVIVVDELGRLEASGGGHLRALRDEVDGDRAGWWVLAVRRDGLAAITQWLGPPEDRIDLAGGGDAAARAADRIVARVRREIPGSGKEEWFR